MRGAAFLLMVVYHAAWDADFLGLVDLDLRSASWEALRWTTLSLFLGLVGVSLALAALRRLDRRTVLRRLALVGGAAILVSAASAIAFPDGLITFGVLHCIAVAGVLALPFLKLPVGLVAAAGVVVLALGAFHHPAFDPPWLNWLGFASTRPPARDYVPLVPWFGVVLLGLAVGRGTALRLGPATSPPGGSGRLLSAIGRNCLVLYLVHQPALYGALLVLAAAIGHAPAHTADFTRAFLQSCQESCRASSVGTETCAARCDCVLTAVRREFDARDLLSAVPTAEQSARLDALAQSCAESHLRGRDRR